MEERGGQGGHQSQRKPRRGRGQMPRGNRGRGQGGSPSASPSASPNVSSTTASPSPTVSSSSPATPDVVDVKVPSIETKTVVSSVSESPKPMETPLAKLTQNIAPQDLHQFEKSVREVESSSLPKTDKTTEERKAELENPLPEVVKLNPKEKESESAVTSTTATPISTSQPEKPVMETPKGEKPEKEPRVLIVEPTPKQSGHNPPEEIHLPLDPPISKSHPEKGVSPGRDLPAPLSFAYGLGGPVGKPGYIGKGPGSYAGSDVDDPWDDGPGKRSRRVSSMSEVKATVMGFSKRQWAALTIFGIADLFSAILISLQAPFYPKEAESKGSTATEYGLVFGIFELVVMLMSPVFGKYMNKLGPKNVFNVGILTTGTSCILFGLLDRIDDHTWFITLSFIIRIVEATGNAAFITATFTIIACEFPESVATTFASLETFFGLGLILGPTVGGALYQVGGYPLPFLCTGIALISIGFVASFVMPKSASDKNADGKTSEGYGIFSILKIPAVALAALSIMMGANSIGFLNATLEPHIRQFGLTPLQTGLVFIISGGLYAMTAPGFGWLCDKISQPKYIMFFGAVVAFVAFLLIGPAPFIPIETTLWLSAVGLLIHGISLGAILVSGFIIALKDCLYNGFPDNISTYGVVSGLWTSMLSLGAFIGPSIGGLLLDNVGFRNGSLYILIGEGFVMVLVLLFIVFSKRPSGKKGDAESQPLLGSGSPQPGPSKQMQLYGTTGESDA